MTNDKGELDLVAMFRTILADKEAKKVFLAMPREEQLLAILGIQAYTGNELAKTQSALGDLSDTVKKNERNAVAYRRKREEKEGNGNDDTSDMPMTQKIVKTVKNRFDQLMTLALVLYVIIQGRAP